MNLKLYNYLKQDEFKELREELRRKYVNYGSCIGSISITPTTKEEVDKLSGFLSKSLSVNKKIKIKITDIQKSLDDSPFNGITVNQLVIMFNPKIKSNKEIRIKQNKYIEDCLKEYRDIYKETDIEKIFYDDKIVKKIKYCLNHNKKLLDDIFNALNKLPINSNSFEMLAIFSTNIVGNPHYFDLDTPNSNLFIQFICYLFNLEYTNDRKEKIKILEKAGIYVDNVSNSIITYNLYGNEMLNSFKDNLEPLTINLSNVYKMHEIYTEENKLLIIENPSFLSKIIGKKTNYSVIITSGNPNIILYKILEKIKNSKIYYNGDFDPEGLLIAEKLINFNKNIKLLGYCEEYYQNGLSDILLTDARLKKLDVINNKELIYIKNLILKNKLASYQEANYNKIIKEMNSNI